MTQMLTQVRTKTNTRPLDGSRALLAASDFAREVYADLAENVDFDHALMRMETVVARYRAAFLAQVHAEADSALARLFRQPHARAETIWFSLPGGSKLFGRKKKSDAPATAKRGTGAPAESPRGDADALGRGAGATLHRDLRAQSQLGVTTGTLG